ncbi:MAG: c-type cytochrome, partial [Opitutaceae bacterium]
EPTAPDGGQWGLTQDNFGKPWFVNAGGETGPTNFQYPIAYGAFTVRQQLTPDYKEVWPLVAIPDVEGGARRFRPIEKTLNHITAACGADIYRGDHLPADLVGDLLYCEPVGRLIRRTKIETRAGLTYLRNAYEKSEFIRSSDPYFRPINLVTAPDGALYITDMSRGIVQEGNWTKKGSYLRTVIEQYSLDQNINNGRIWRLVREGQPLGPRPHMLDETPAQLVPHLAHPNGWWRDTAQKLLILAEDLSVVPALQTMARTHPDTLARFHALWTLEGLGALDAALIHETLHSPSPELRVAALRLGETLIKAGELTLRTATLALFQDPDPAVANQAMLSAQLLKLPEAKVLIQKTAVTHASPSVKEIASQLLNPLSGQIAPGFDPAARNQLQHGKQIYQELCFACHGIDGRGTPIDGSAFTLAPPLAGSNSVLSHRDLALNAVIFGLAGPVAGHAYDAQMAPMGANDDAWLADIVSYIRTSFGNTAGLVSISDVARLRAANPSRTEAWTLAALHPLVPQRLPNRAAWRLTSNRVRHAADAALTTSPITLPFTVESSQTSGAWLQIELPTPATLCEIRLGSTQYPRNAPRALSVELSANGTDWSAPIASVKGNAPVLEFCFAATPAKFLRITQTDPATNAPWSLDDLVLFSPPVTSAMTGSL